MAKIPTRYRVKAAATVGGRKIRRSFVAAVAGPIEARIAAYERLKKMKDPEVVEDYTILNVRRVR